MDVQLKGEVSKIPRPLSVPFRVWGWLAFAGAFPLALRFVYEQTVMTLNHGIQRPGWTLVDTAGEIVVLGILAAILLHGWLRVFVVVWVRRSITQNGSLQFGEWRQFLLLVCGTVLLSVPYELWQFATLEVSRPRQHA